jgi:hypothetical protein
MSPLLTNVHETKVIIGRGIQYPQFVVSFPPNVLNRLGILLNRSRLFGKPVVESEFFLLLFRCKALSSLVKYGRSSGSVGVLILTPVQKETAGSCGMITLSVLQVESKI